MALAATEICMECKAMNHYGRLSPSPFIWYLKQLVRPDMSKFKRLNANNKKELSCKGRKTKGKTSLKLLKRHISAFKHSRSLTRNPWTTVFDF